VPLKWYSQKPTTTNLTIMDRKKFSKTGLVALALLAATVAGIFLVPRPEKPAAVDSGKGPNGRQPLQPRWPGQLLATTQQRASGLAIHRAMEEAPSWAVAYGHEFWRRPAPGPAQDVNPNAPVTANFNLGDIISRVSHAITREDDASLPRIKAKMFTATFDGDGLRFSPHRATTREDGTPVLAPDPSVEARFRTLRIQCGEHALYSNGAEALAWSILGNTAQRELNPALGVVEHFETASDGVEVTWVLNQRPQWEGHLDIQAEFSGLTYSHQDAAGHHFADAQGTPRVKIGQTVLVDAKGTRTELPLVARDGQLHVQVTEGMLAQAVFPVAIDPTISPEFGMSATMADNNEYFPHLASNGTNYLVVWSDDRDGNFSHSVFGARVTTAGEVLDPTGININSTGINPAAGTDGANYLVVWEDTSMNISGTRITSGGTILDSTRLAICTNSAAQQFPRVAGTGTNYLVVWQDRRDGVEHYDIYGSRVTSSGLVINPNGFFIGAAVDWGISDQDIAANGTNFLVVWRVLSVLAARVTATGTVLDTTPITINTSGNYPGVASDGTNWMVVYGDSAPTDIHGKRVSSSGTVLDSSAIVISGASGYQSFPKIAGNANGYFVVWEEEKDLYGARVTGSGSVLDSPGVPICVSSQSEAELAEIACAGSGFLVVWTDDRNSSSTEADVYGARITSAGVVLDLIPISTANGESNVQRDAAVGSNGTDFLVAWRDNRNSSTAEDIYATRVRNDGVVLDLSGIAICTASGHQFVPAIASDGTNYLVAWVDQRSATTGRDIYINRVTSAGAVLDGNGIGVCITNGTQSYVAIARSGTTFLVAWDDDRNFGSSSFDVYAARVTSAASVLDPNGFAVASGASLQNIPGVASLGTNFLVAWNHRPAGTSYDEIYGARVTTAGTVLDAGGFAICTATNSQAMPAVGSNGTDYFVVWHDYRNSVQPDIYGTRVSSSGTVLDTSGIAISSAASNQYYPAVANLGTNYMVVWGDTRNTGIDIYGARVTGAGVVLDTSGFTINTASGWQDYPSIASNGSKYLVAYQSDTTGTLRLRGNLVTP
jgi:hypothetical protein